MVSARQIRHADPDRGCIAGGASCSACCSRCGLRRASSCISCRFRPEAMPTASPALRRSIRSGSSRPGRGDRGQRHHGCVAGAPRRTQRPAGLSDLRAFVPTGRSARRPCRRPGSIWTGRRRISRCLRAIARAGRLKRARHRTRALRSVDRFGRVRFRSAAVSRLASATAAAPNSTVARRPADVVLVTTHQVRALELCRQHRALALSDRPAPSPAEIWSALMWWLSLIATDRCLSRRHRWLAAFKPAAPRARAGLSRPADMALSSRPGVRAVYPGLDFQRLPVDG